MSDQVKGKMCTACGGLRKVFGLGSMSHTCASCKGTGRIAVDEFVCDICKKEIAKKVCDDDKIVDKEIKKRRTKKVEELKEGIN